MRRKLEVCLTVILAIGLTALGAADNCSETQVAVCCAEAEASYLPAYNAWMSCTLDLEEQEFGCVGQLLDECPPLPEGEECRAAAADCAAYWGCQWRNFCCNSAHDAAALAINGTLAGCLSDMGCEGQQLEENFDACSKPYYGESCGGQAPCEQPDCYQCP